MIPFSIEEFLSVFEQYNLSVWPMQVFLYLLAVIALILVFIQKDQTNKVINSILAFFWLWMGIVYHLFNFSSINKAAYLFGVLFIVQGGLFAYVGFFRSEKLKYQFTLDFTTILGMLFILYALVIYPILAHSLGHIYPVTPTFGLPCPTTIFTFGILLFSIQRIPWYILLIPFLWSFIGFSAAMHLTIKEDFGLVVAGVLGTVALLFFKPRQNRLVSNFSAS